MTDKIDYQEAYRGQIEINKDLREQLLNMEQTATEQVGDIEVLGSRLAALEEHLRTASPHMWADGLCQYEIVPWFAKAREILRGSDE